MQDLGTHRFVYKWSVHIFLAQTCSCVTYVASQLVIVINRSRRR